MTFPEKRYFGKDLDSDNSHENEGLNLLGREILNQVLKTRFESLPAGVSSNGDFITVETAAIEISDDRYQKPSLNISGLAKNASKEAAKRVKYALEVNGFSFPHAEVLVNLSPPDQSKTDPNFDLAIALLVLAMTNQVENQSFSQTMVLGTLSLNGRVNKINGVFHSVKNALDQEMEQVLVPRDNYYEALLIKEMVPDSELKIIPIESLFDAVLFLNGQKEVETEIPDLKEVYMTKEFESNLDFSDIKGQEDAIQAVELAVAGGHHFNLIGPPGCGKSMIIDRLETILPPLDDGELFELVDSLSKAGKFDPEIIFTRQRRYTVLSSASTEAGIRGSDTNFGEAALANVLALDEFPEFNRKILDALKELITRREVSTSRASGTRKLNSNFLLVSSMNHARTTGASLEEQADYQKKISSALWERFHMIIEMDEVDPDALNQERYYGNSAEIKQRIEAAREIQKQRFANSLSACNGEMADTELEKFCVLNDQDKEFLHLLIKRFQMSARDRGLLLRVARTRADMQNREEIDRSDIEYAASFRKRQFSF